MFESERLRCDLTGNIMTVTLDQPETRNALDDGMLDDLIETVEVARKDGAVRVVVLTSSHPTVFSSGGDLRAFRDGRRPVEKYDGMERFPRLYRALARVGKPVICAANGHVLAGAFGIALACDLVIAKRSARFGCPEINIGAFPFMISALIYRNVGRLKANELVFLGDQISATEAERLGIINRAVPDDEFDDQIAAWAGRLADKSPLLVRMGKDAVNETADMGRYEAMHHLRGQLALAFTTDDLREGVDAFFEEREPMWRGR